MLSIGKLAAGPDTGRYYVDQVASGREDYYSGEGETAGRWVGAGAISIGLDGEVGDDELIGLLSGRHPRSGQDLGRSLRSGDVAGFDLTFRAPKSVSILFGIGDEEMSAELRDGHEVAVGEALAYLEREACIVRRGHGGAVQLPATGFVAAAFRHRASRAGDPLLHTHVVVANAAEGPDGRFTALFGRPIHAQAKTAGYLYQAVLRDELTQRLGLDWDPVSNGAADVSGVPRETIDRFSTRRREIVAALHERGEHSARAAQIATLDTRRAKQLEPVADQREHWRSQARACGLTPQDARELRWQTDGARDPANRDVIADRLLGAHGLTEQQTTFDRGRVLQAMAELAPRGARVTTLEAQADALLTDPRIETLPDGRYTTRELVRIERDLIATAAARRDERPAVDATRSARQAASTRTLSSEQAVMVDQLVTGRGGVQIVRAPAGTGKTFALDAARDAWNQAGVPVLGCALSARAAGELRDQAAIDATTVARLRMALDEGSGLRPGSVLVVDEAGMVGTRDLAALARAAEAAPARLVLVGDDRQLPEIDAGGAFAALARQGPTVELHEVRRQREGWDRDALRELRDGDLDAFARSYVDQGRVVAAPDAPTARERLVEDWWQAREQGQDALMLALRRVDVADLNARARDKLRAAGHLGDDQLTCGQRSFAVGDRVIATRNDRRLGLHNGQVGRVVELADDAVQLELPEGRVAELPVRYAHDGHLDHAYATTVHKAQGATVDCTFVLGSDDQYREWGYTALTRHRDKASFYISGRREFVNQPADLLTGPDDVLSAVADALRDTRHEQLASERREHARAADLAHRERSVEEAVRRRALIEEQRERTNLFRPRQRAALAERAETADQSIARTTKQLSALHADRPPEEAGPKLLTAVDPLKTLDPQAVWIERTRALLQPDIDVGMDMGW